MKFHLRKPIPWGKIMKITFSQILIALMISGVAYCSPLKAQDVLNKKVSISVKNTTLLNVLTDLQNNNDVKFIYSKNAIDVNQKITVDFENAPMKEVLDQVFKNNGIDYQIIENSIILGKMKDAQAPAAEAPSAPASATA